jgi:Flp pilus assembly protein TadG
VRPGRGRVTDDGVLSLELALTVPALFLLLLVVFHGAVYTRDALIVQGAAREGARVASTTSDDAAVAAVVRAALDGREAAVVVTPRGRPGEVVSVTVSMRSRAGRGGLVVTASAATTVEPGLGR